jgi:DNA-binding CsgD family transcriptional regulator
MEMRVADDWSLTEKEKQTLRLIVRGHDAKSIARSLGLSVHTINERLRDARRKMSVSSSREAARLLLEAEGGDPSPPAPKMLGDMPIGEAEARDRSDEQGAPNHGAGRAARSLWILIGVVLMTTTLGLLALALFPLMTPAAPPALPTPPQAQSGALADKARQWLALLDQGRWEESYRETGSSFRKLNTAQAWAQASEKARTPLGAMVSRTFVSQQNLPAPPEGYEVVKFRTRFANKADAIETVTFDREGGDWRVVGITVE